MNTLEGIVGKDEANKLRKSWSNRKNRLAPYYLELKSKIEVYKKKMKDNPNAYSVHLQDWYNEIELSQNTMRKLEALMKEFGIEIPS